MMVAMYDAEKLGCLRCGVMAKFAGTVGRPTLEEISISSTEVSA
jgi:hypothetical protein